MDALNFANSKLHSICVYVRKGGGREVIFFMKDMTGSFKIKWMWYFNYRAALYQVKNPRAVIVIDHGIYDHVPKEEFLAKILRDKIRNRKGKITEWEGKVKRFKENWNSLFPIEENPSYKSALARIERAKQEKENLEAEFQIINQSLFTL
jgi:hypothetical protein